jgi:hypothetical protein
MIESKDDYEAILNNEDLTTRRKAATEAASYEVWLDILSQRPDLEEEVAFNKHLPAAILDILIDSRSHSVRAAIAMKRALNNQQFLKLANDTDDSVRIMVANNRNAPKAVLDILASDPCEIVLNAARRQLQDRSDKA